MAKISIHKPRCLSCEYYGVHNESVPKKVAGAFLRVGCRYCSGGKKIRVFKRSDPKVYIPSWCPRRKEPAEMRIYCYKDANAWYLNFLFEQDGARRFPSGHNYAVRHECSTVLTAKGFYELTEQQLISDILGFSVWTNEVIEIDDGLKPYFFLVHEYGIEVLAYFDRDMARKNKLDRPDLDDRTREGIVDDGDNSVGLDKD